MKRGAELQLGCFGRPQRGPSEGLVRLWGAIGALWVQPNADPASAARDKKEERPGQDLIE